MYPLLQFKLAFFFLYAFLAAAFNFQGIYYSQVFHLTLSQIGLLQSVSRFLSLIAATLILNSALMTPTRLLQVISLLSILIWASHLFETGPLFPSAFVKLSVLTICSSFTVHTLPSLLDSLAMRMLKTSFGEARVFGSIGFGISSVVTGYAIAFLNKPSISVVVACLFCICFLFSLPVTLEVLKEETVQCDSKPSTSSITAQSSFRSSWSMSTVLFFASVACMGCAFSTCSSFLFLYLKETWEISSSFLGVASIFQAALELPVFHYSSYLVKRMGGVKQMAIIAHLFLFVRFVFYMSLPLVSAHLYTKNVILAVELLHGPAFAAYYSSGMILAEQNGDSIGSKSVFTGLFGSIYNNFGGFFGSLLGGYIYNTYGSNYLWIFALASSLFSLLLLVMSLQHKGKLKVD